MNQRDREKDKDREKLKRPLWRFSSLLCGVLPGGGPDGRDALILQKVNIETVDWLGSQLASPLAREIFTYIRCDCEQWAGGENAGGDAHGGN